MESVRYDELMNYLVHRKNPEYMTENQSNWLRQQAKKYIVDDDRLKYFSTSNQQARVVLREDETHQVFCEIHESKFGSHPGINTTIKLISNRYYWPNLTKDVKKWVKECASCQMNDPIRPPRAPELQSINVKRPFEMVGIDLMGPFNQTSEGYKYIFTCTDYFTKWVEAFPMKTKTALETTSCLEKVISRHGAFQAILTDQGREFVNQVNERLCKSWNIQHKVTAVYHPQTNGLDERTNQTLKQKLRKAVNDNQDNWDQYLDGALFSMRMAPQSSTKFSPFRLLYGREPCVPSELPEMPLEMNATRPLPTDEKINDYVEQTTTQRKETEEKVKENIKRAQEKQKKDYKKRKSTGYVNFSVGDSVKLYNCKKKAKKGVVLEENYLGPYEIVKIIGKKCVLKCVKTGKVMKVCQNIDNIKPYQKQHECNTILDYLRNIQTTGVFQQVLQECQQLPLVRVRTVADIDTAMADPVFSLVSEVSKSYEGLMDIVAENVTQFVDESSTDRTKTDIVTIAAAVITMSYTQDMSPSDVLETLKIHPDFLKKTTTTESDGLRENERLLVCGESVAVDDINTLLGKEWLNDRVVNAYLKQLARENNNADRPQVFVIPSYTGTLWANDVFDSHMFRKAVLGMYQHILMPWCMNSHWVLLVADIQKRTVGVLDSLNRDNSAIINKFCEFMMRRGTVTEPELTDCWVTVNLKSSLQKDGCSCGIFVLMNAECIANKKNPIVMRQVHAGPFRDYVKKRLIGEGIPCGTTECDGLLCRKPRGPANWIQCDVCHRWWHKICANVDRKVQLQDYSCIICVAQYC